MLGWYSSYRLMAEFSTPFVNIRWILYAIGMKNTRRYKINGLLMTISFFVCRILAMPFYWYYVAKNYSLPEFKTVPKQMVVFWLLLPALLDCLNLFWFHKMVNGIIKALKTPDVDEKEVPKPKFQERMKQKIKTRYANFKSIIMRRKPEILRRRSE
jgi:hypothetical protein